VNVGLNEENARLRSALAAARAPWCGGGERGAGVTNACLRTAASGPDVGDASLLARSDARSSDPAREIVLPGQMACT